MRSSLPNSGEWCRWPVPALPGLFRLPHRNRKHRVIVVSQIPLIPHGRSVPPSPIVRPPLGAAALKATPSVFVEHGEENLVGLVFAAQIIERGQGKEGKAACCSAILVVLEPVGVVRSHAASDMTVGTLVHIILQRNGNKGAAQSHVELVVTHLDRKSAE